MSSHVDYKDIRYCARVVALCTNKGLLSAVNQHVGFQVGMSVRRVATLATIVIFLCSRRDIVVLGHLRNSRSVFCLGQLIKLMTMR